MQPPVSLALGLREWWSVVFMPSNQSGSTKGTEIEMNERRVGVFFATQCTLCP